MASDSVDVRLSHGHLMKCVTLNVTLTGVRVWRVRQDAGIWLIRLASYVMGCGVHVEIEDD